LTRDELIEFLKKSKIGTSVHFQPLHLQPYYRKLLGTKEGDLPVTEKVGREVLSLPFFPTMEKEEQDQVVFALKRALLEVKV